MALTIGSLLAGRYEITAPIATGGMGEVWRARDQVLDRTVAAKVLKSEYTDDPSFLARFRNEARHTAALTHPNIASVYDYGETEEDGQRLAFLVMEFVEGHPLVTILHEEGRLPVDWTLHVLSQSADGLSAAHRAGVVHRDIKPGNLMVRPDGVVKLTDFGIAQARDATPLTRTGMVVGTAQYLSPEQAQGMEVNAASDVYSLGVVGYECLAGSRPFDGASQVAIALAHINRPPPPLPADIPPAVRLLIDRALAKDPTDRFADGGAFAEAVRRVAAGGSLAAMAAPVAVPHHSSATASAGAPATAPTQVVGDLSESRTQVLGAAATGAALGAVGGAGVAAAGPRTGPARPMPPLQAPDDDGLEPLEPLPEEEPDRSKRWLWIAAALAVLLLVGGLTWWLVGSGSEAARDPVATPPPPATTASVTTVTLDPAAFVGKPADEVRRILEDRGLTVVETPATEAQLAGAGQELAVGDVADLEPTGTPLGPDATVTLYVAQTAFDPDAAEETTEAPVTEAPVTTEAPVATTEPPTTAPTTTVAPPTTATTTAPSTAASSTAQGEPAPSGGEQPPVESEPADPTVPEDEELPGAQPGADGTAGAAASGP